MTKRIAWLAIAVLAWAGGAGAAQLSEQRYPNRPIRLVIPFAPGGATDIIARVLEPRLTRRLGQQIVVDNRSGAAGNIAVEIVAQAQPDGYTLLVGNISTNSINPILFAKRMKVNAVRDLAGVTKLVAIPNFILGSPKIPATTLKEALDYARQRSGQLNYQAPLGSYSHLDMLALTAAAGVKMVHLPSKGAGETLPALLRGDIHITESNVASNIGAVRAGQVKAFAVTSEKRLADLPNVPTMAEAGYPGIGSLNWNGIFAPVRTPKEVVARLHAEIVAAMNELESEGLLARRAIPISLSASPAGFSAYVVAEMKRWDKIITDNNVKID
ncbi:MAG: tripartite tricarboxylate transporter substrate binding protein [Betaproteobacteria bacterium]|nr:tripartite tricarboxylate transporter substrate binding protein [Betaproteobacteria bacterium]